MQRTNGMHINEDHFIAEIINPETGEVLPEGEKKENWYLPVLRKKPSRCCAIVLVIFASNSGKNVPAAVLM